MTAARELAPAKLNLALHVRGRLPDGRHAIETIFAFCSDGDRLSAEPADALSLAAAGPFAGELPPPDNNLVLRAARALQEQAGVAQGAAIRLDKQLPVASGIGGGSADAAAALRLLTSLWRIDPKHAEAVAPGIGSDVPACLLSLAARGDGAGDELTPVELPELAGAPVLLVNARVELVTKQVFERWDGVDHGPLRDWQEGRNDLEPAAISLVPQIQTVLAWLSVHPGARFVRMSGSGATCFGLFDSARAAAAGARALRERHADWWVRAASLG